MDQVHKPLHAMQLLFFFFFCLTVISLKSSEDSSFEKKKETWAFFEGNSYLFLYYKMQPHFQIIGNE